MKIARRKPLVSARSGRCNWHSQSGPSLSLGNVRPSFRLSDSNDERLMVISMCFTPANKKAAYSVLRGELWLGL
jgi:hypothetical protein